MSDKMKGLTRKNVLKLFGDIIGWDEVKETIASALCAPKPVHVLLVGPPGSAKSLFLEAIEEIQGSRYLLGGTTRKAGLARWLLENPCERLVYDEIEKTPLEDLNVLLPLMEGGTVALMTADNANIIHNMDIRVIAAGNSIERIQREKPELLSRFLVVEFRAYSEEEFGEIVGKMLVKREGVPADLAKYIAKQCIRRGFLQVRDAVRVARMVQAKGKMTRAGVDAQISFVERYSPSNVLRFQCNNHKCSKKGRIVRILKEE